VCFYSLRIQVESEIGKAPKRSGNNPATPLCRGADFYEPSIIICHKLFKSNGDMNGAHGC